LLFVCDIRQKRHKKIAKFFSKDKENIHYTDLQTALLCQ
jgi:hypothetical protein